jgi:hypothetical protein
MTYSKINKIMNNGLEKDVQKILDDRIRDLENGPTDNTSHLNYPERIHLSAWTGLEDCYYCDGRPLPSDSSDNLLDVLKSWKNF